MPGRIRPHPLVSGTGDGPPSLRRLAVWVRPGGGAPDVRIELGPLAVVLGGNRSVDIGSKPTCHIVLDTAGVAPVHAQYFRMSNHRFLRLSPLSVATARGGGTLGPGGEHRIDRSPFSIGGVELQFEEHERPIVGRWAPLEIP